MRCFIRTLLLLAVAATGFSLHATDGKKKMVWAHVVAWGFFQESYDNAGDNPDRYNEATDRTLLGKLVQSRAGCWSNARAQINSARMYGIDGFCVDMVDPKGYVDLERFYKAAEGTDFRIALAMDNYVHRPADFCIEHIGKFLKKFYNHPNNAYIDGKPVVFIYNLGMSISEWGKVVAALKEQGLEAYYLHRAVPEYTLADDKEAMKNSLAVNNGLYDFGCNGYTLPEMKQRLKNLSDALCEHRPDGMLVAGVACGYLGRAVGNYRPFMNSLSTIWNWDAVIANPRVNWVCISTWNDYTETTHIEPSVVNRDALALLNQEYARVWKGEPLHRRPVQPIVSYHEEVIAGDDLTIEVLNFPYTETESALHLRAVGDSKQVLLAQDVSLPKNRIHAETLRIKHEAMREVSTIRITAMISGKDGNLSKSYELYPVIRRPERLEVNRIIRQPLSQLARQELTFRYFEPKGQNPVLRAVLNGYEIAGTLEVLRNGYPVAVREINHSGKPQCIVDFPMPESKRAGQDLYVARFTNVSGEFCFSNPFKLEAEPDAPKIKTPVIVTGSDYDENWPLWKKPSRFPVPKLDTINISANALFQLVYPLNEGEGKIARSATAWNLPLMLGKPGELGYRVQKDDKVMPEWVEIPGADGKKRQCLRFFGTSVATLPVRTMPAGIFTLELLIQTPELPGEEAVLFGEQKPLSLRLTPEGKIAFDYLQNPQLISDAKVTPGKWHHIAVVSHGNKLELYLDGKRTAQIPQKMMTYAINSYPALGNCSRSRVNGFDGFVGGLAITGTSLDAKDFKLLQRK